MFHSYSLYRISEKVLETYIFYCSILRVLGYLIGLVIVPNFRTMSNLLLVKFALNALALKYAKNAFFSPCVNQTSTSGTDFVSQSLVIMKMFIFNLDVHKSHVFTFPFDEVGLQANLYTIYPLLYCWWRGIYALPLFQASSYSNRGYASSYGSWNIFLV